MLAITPYNSTSLENSDNFDKCDGTNCHSKPKNSHAATRLASSNNKTILDSGKPLQSIQHKHEGRSRWRLQTVSPCRWNALKSSHGSYRSARRFLELASSPLLHYKSEQASRTGNRALDEKRQKPHDVVTNKPLSWDRGCSNSGLHARPQKSKPASIAGAIMLDCTCDPEIQASLPVIGSLQHRAVIATSREPSPGSARTALPAGAESKKSTGILKERRNCKPSTGFGSAFESKVL